MVEKKTVNKSGKDIIRASEIGQYYFCSNSWYLQKCGYQPISKQLEFGTKKHEELGRIIDNLEKENKRSNIFTAIGIILLIITILIFLFEVVL
jgi:hypothetical protein